MFESLTLFFFLANIDICLPAGDLASLVDPFCCHFVQPMVDFSPVHSKGYKLSLSSSSGETIG